MKVKKKIEKKYIFIALTPKKNTLRTEDILKEARIFFFKEKTHEECFECEIKIMCVPSKKKQKNIDRKKKKTQKKKYFHESDAKNKYPTH